MTQFAEVLDELQISPSLPGNEPQRHSSPTIISKFRSNFLPNSRQLTSRSSKTKPFNVLFFCYLVFVFCVQS